MLRGFRNAVLTFYLKNDFEALNYLIFALIYFIATFTKYSLQSIQNWESNIAAIFTIKAITSNAQLYCFSFLVYSTILGLTTFFYTNANYFGKTNDEKLKYILHTIILLIITFLNLSFYIRAKSMEMESGLFFIYNLGFGFVYSLLVTKSRDENNPNSKLIKVAYMVVGTLTMQAIPVLLSGMTSILNITV